jgi:hypothetical protein
MTSHFRGWIQAFLLSVAMATAVHGSDILLNTDFSDGKTHWRGDGQSDVAPLSGGKLVITLNPDKWTAVSQRFSANATALKVIARYSLSEDCTLGKMGDKLVPPLTPDALNQICGVGSLINIPASEYELWKVLVASGNMLVSEGIVSQINRSRSSDDSSGEKTYTADLNSWLGSFNDCTLCLCFPPGQGSVTLFEVKLLAPGQ